MHSTERARLPESLFPKAPERTSCAIASQCKPMYAPAGIGAYTGNAMASIAANERVAAVDANVVRVLSRLRCLSMDPKAKSSVQLHAQLADSLVDPDRPGDFNQVRIWLLSAYMVQNGAMLTRTSFKSSEGSCPLPILSKHSCLDAESGTCMQLLARLA